MTDGSVALTDGVVTDGSRGKELVIHNYETESQRTSKLIDGRTTSRIMDSRTSSNAESI